MKGRRWPHRHDRMAEDETAIDLHLYRRALLVIEGAAGLLQSLMKNTEVAHILRTVADHIEECG